MKFTLRKTLGALLAIMLVAYGCTDRGLPVEPLLEPNVRVGGPLLSTSPTREVVSVLTRSAPLPAEIKASAVIGWEGGTISIPDAGLKVTIPTGALDVATNITITALKGDLVAYTFEPHGTRFAKVVYADQSLATTQAVDSVSSRGYFSTMDAIDWETNSAVVSEISEVQPELTSTSIRFYLNHFSGYLLGVSRTPPPPLP
jgi:hypothetical protein